MAGTITHLAVANEILKELPDGIITNQDLFYAGSMAPDAIHAREGFIRADKKHTHLRDDIADYDFYTIENLTLFHNRVTNFINENLNRKDNLLDLYRGYVVHLLTDETFMLTVRQEFVQEMDKLGIAQTDKMFYANILHDLSSNDYRIAKENEQMQHICALLENVQPHAIDNYLTENELNISRNWVVQNYFYKEEQISDFDYISYDRTLKYIKEASNDIITRLSDGIMFPKIF